MSEFCTLFLSLELSWQNLLQNFGVDSAIARKTFLDIANLYSSPNRFYHNLDHVSQVLQVIELLRSLALEPDTIAFAAWFHDVIYDAKSNDNEEKSAEYAASLLNYFKLSSKLINSVTNLILKTKTHRYPDNDIDSQILMDADLSILGADVSNYRRYSQAIRQEYSWVSDESYQVGRLKFLQNILQRPRIYLTDTMFATLEINARGNIQTEIQYLLSL